MKLFHLVDRLDGRWHGTSTCRIAYRKEMMKKNFGELFHFRIDNLLQKMRQCLMIFERQREVNRSPVVLETCDQMPNAMYSISDDRVCAIVT